jgi:hypothetical protein
MTRQVHVPAFLPPGKRVACSHWVGDWVSSVTSLKVLPLPRVEPGTCNPKIATLQTELSGHRWKIILKCNKQFFKSRDSSVGIALGYRLDDRGSRVRFPAGAGNFSVHHHIQNGSGAHLASYPMGTRGFFPGSKAAGAWSWPLTSILCRDPRMSGAIHPLPHTPSWRGA